MIAFVTSRFVPVQFHVQRRLDMVEKFGAQWTPTLVVLDADGAEHHRIEGFLPVEDLLAELQLGLAKLEFGHHRFPDAERRFQEVIEHHPHAAVVPEARYWAGVSAYKVTDQSDALREAGRWLKARYPESAWTRKASVWDG